MALWPLMIFTVMLCIFRSASAIHLRKGFRNGSLPWHYQPQGCKGVAEHACNVGGRKFAPMCSSYKPHFYVCEQAKYDQATLEDTVGRFRYSPSGADAGHEHDCDHLSALMALSAHDNGTFVDVGASEGMCSLLLLSKGYSGTGYEPEEELQTVGLDSIRVNGFQSRGTVARKYVGDVSADTMVTLDEQHRGEHVNVLKIDNDGSELKTLRGAQLLLAHGRVDIVQLELVPPEISGQVRKQLFELLMRNGYRIFAIYYPERPAFQYFGNTEEQRNIASTFLAKKAPKEARVAGAGGFLSHPDDADQYTGWGEAFTQYQYGDEALTRFKFIPQEANEDEIWPYHQYAAIRVGTQAWDTVQSSGCLEGGFELRFDEAANRVQTSC